ncbi:MAG TPA: hypothetical protein EYQ50_20250 [Verrucomicrobiales bacterium]|nr:hypothetical protein [Verrucomicrobiales bacterium]
MTISPQNPPSTPGFSEENISLRFGKKMITNWETEAFLPIKGHRERVVRFLHGGEDLPLEPIL